MGAQEVSVFTAPAIALLRGLQGGACMDMWPPGHLLRFPVWWEPTPVALWEFGVFVRRQKGGTESTGRAEKPRLQGVAVTTLVRVTTECPTPHHLFLGLLVSRCLPGGLGAACGQPGPPTTCMVGAW